MRHRWRWAIVSSALGMAVFALAWVNGYAWEMLWLPGVMLGAAWPRGRSRCVRRPRS